MKTINNDIAARGDESQTFGSFIVRLLDDESAVLALPTTCGHVLIASVGSANHGMAWFRSSTAVKYFGGSVFDVLINTVLEGSTGTDGKLTMSTNGGNFYLENRTGASIDVNITFFGISVLRD